MLKKDFKETNRITKEIKKHKHISFCECCLNSNPETEDGYTSCCNERVVFKDEALQNSKRNDIQSFLETKFEVSSHLESVANSKVIFVLPNKNKKFMINTNNSIETIIDLVKYNIKGLRKEIK